MYGFTTYVAQHGEMCRTLSYFEVLDVGFLTLRNRSRARCTRTDRDKGGQTSHLGQLDRRLTCCCAASQLCACACITYVHVSLQQNDTYLDDGANFGLITGPNMS